MQDYPECRTYEVYIYCYKTVIDTLDKQAQVTDGHREQSLYPRQGHMIEACGLWVDPVLENVWADLKRLIWKDSVEL